MSRTGVPIQSDDSRMLAAATLKGLVGTGTTEGLRIIGLDNAESNDLKRAVYSQAVDALNEAPGPWGKGIDIFGDALGDTIFGNTSNIPPGVWTRCAVTKLHGSVQIPHDCRCRAP